MTRAARPAQDLGPRHERFVEEYLLDVNAKAGCDPSGILAENSAGADALVSDGWTEAWRAPRLIRGEPLDWQPDHIWGQFNHAMG